MAEVVGELGAPEGAVPIPISEPDVCRALTGVAEEALPEREFPFSGFIYPLTSR